MTVAASVVFYKHFEESGTRRIPHRIDGGFSGWYDLELG
jgi:hypothetical protein